MRTRRNALRAAVAVAILILGAGCSQSPTAPSPTGESLSAYAEPE